MVIKLPFISREHGRIVARKGKKPFIVDTGSKNGIYVNGKKMFFSGEVDVYSMVNGLGFGVEIVEDYGNNRSYLVDWSESMNYEPSVTMFPDATKAANVAFKRGFRE
jgi:hypothetical protein